MADAQDRIGDPQELSYGEKAVGLKFNPSGNEKVDRIKRLYAEIIDLHNDQIIDIGQREGPHPELGEMIRLHKVAITEAQGSQMWSVKAITSES